MTKAELENFEKKAIDLKEYVIGKEYPNCEIYRIPFTLIDKTPGGKSYGRINWNFEIIRSKKRNGGWFSGKDKRVFIEKIYIWARQTRDKRVSGKVFKLDLLSERLNGNVFNEHSSVEPCTEHLKGTIVSTYPNNEHSWQNECILEISATTSVMVDINFMQNN